MTLKDIMMSWYFENDETEVHFNDEVYDVLNPQILKDPKFQDKWTELVNTIYELADQIELDY